MTLTHNIQLLILNELNATGNRNSLLIIGEVSLKRGENCPNNCSLCTNDPKTLQMFRINSFNTILKIISLLCISVLVIFHLVYNQIHLLHTQNSIILPLAVRHLQFPSSSSTCKTRSCYYWNPSIMIRNTSDGLVTYVAVRESTRGYCGGTDTVASMINLATRPAASSTLIGIVDNNNDTVKILGKLDDESIQSMGKYHVGHEDPRWIIENNGETLYIMTTVEISSVPRLFLTKILQLGNDNFTTGIPTRLYNPNWWNMRMKNWMHIPLQASDKPATRTEHLLFAFSVDPLLLVWVDPLSGHSEPHYPPPTTNPTPPPPFEIKQRGSSAFIAAVSAPDEQLAFIGLGHNQHGIPELGLPKYSSVLLRLALPATTNNTWTLHKSYPFSLPTTSSYYAHRIQFATTITSINNKIIVSVGDMDCTSHIIDYDRNEFGQWMDQALLPTSDITMTNIE